MTKVFFYAPHPDDETLSMGLPMVYYIANRHQVHLVSMNNGGAAGVTNTLNGAGPCTIGDHPYVHSPDREGYVRLSVQAAANARILEARSALGAMAMVAPGGSVTHHVVNLPDGYGSGQVADSTAPCTPEGIALAKAAILPHVLANPNSFHYTMSESDSHPDHAACGYALREIKADHPTALGAPRFFVSRLYWTVTNGLYPEAVRAAAGGTTADPNGSLEWFNAGPRYNDYANWLRTQVVKPYRTWNPAAGAYGAGYHQVPGQFAANFGAGVKVACLWHA